MMSGTGKVFGAGNSKMTVPIRENEISDVILACNKDNKSVSFLPSININNIQL